MMPMRPQSASASSMEWVVRTMTRPALDRSISAHMRRLVSGSRPVVGSSRKTTAGLPTREMPRDTRRFCPPESVATRAPILKPSPTDLAAASAAARSSRGATPLRRQ
mmetsp:Transcript_18894/g.55450  ORF Transcript_18894/g.55450 Transcript_18894/m.55450 type:complete len:107 (+) Transcript_18894:1298-1618(+)